MPNINGTSGPDELVGTSGDDVLNGGAGADIMYGGLGNDLYFVDDAGDVAIEAAGAGFDYVYTRVSHTLAAGSEVEVLAAVSQQGLDAIDLSGNDYGNLIFANDGANILYGGGGNDSLYGYGGDDLLNGHTGADYMAGGAGNDVYYIDDLGDNADEAAGQGFDVVYTRVSHTLYAGSEVEVLSTSSAQGTDLIDLSGNDYDNLIFGNAATNNLYGGGGSDSLYGYGGDDVLNGHTGADYMAGGTGNDVYYIDDAGDNADEAAGAGFDVVYTRVSHALLAGSEVEVLSTVSQQGTDAINLSGSDFSNTLYGNAGTNILYGGGGGDVLYAFGGDDLLNGHTGADTMYGGLGNDTYFVDDAGDAVIEAAGEGFDAIYTRVSHVLAAGSEVEVLSTISQQGTDTIDLTGNGFGNILYGNAGANILDGGAGSDTLIGFGGSDVFAFTSALGAANIDTVSDFSVADDRFRLAGAAGQPFAALAAGTLAAGGFVIGAAALDADDYLLYDAATGALSYDADGNGAGAAVQFALLGTGLALTAAQFTVAGPANGLAVFTSGASASVAENGPAGSLVYQAAAADPDGDRLVYSLAGADAAAFSIDAATGAVRLLGAADFEAKASYAIVVRAADSGGVLVGKAVTINVTNVAEAPVFSSGTTATIAENAATSTLVYDANATDPDGGAISYALTGADAALFAINAANGEVRLLASADYEARAAYSIVVRATDSGGQSTDRAVAVSVTNVAEAPVFTSGTSASVAENSPTTTVIYDADAADPDGGTISFSLTGADAASFSINAATGEVRLLAPADFETRPSYAIVVRATDSGGQSTDRAVAVSVTDVSETSATPVIAETSAGNDAQGSAQAIDRGVLLVADNGNLYNDDLPSATIQGSLSGNSDTDFYSITLQAGELLVLDIDGTTNSLDSFLRLFRPGSGVALENDDSDVLDAGSNPPFGHNTDSSIRFRAPTSGTYYFSVSSFEGDSSGAYKLHVSIGPVATAAQLFSEDVDNVLSGYSWGQTGLTYAFPTLASQYPAGTSETTDNFEGFNAAQRSTTTAQLGMIASVSGLTFQLAGNPAAANLRFAMSDEPDVAYAYLPTGDALGGSAWFNNSSGDFDAPVRGDYAWLAILHETGHALGLKHGQETPAPVSFDHDSMEYTVMTYRSFPGASDVGGYANEAFGYAQSLMMLDIAALQRLYGANFATNAGDSVYTWSNTTGQMSINGAGQGAPGANRVFLTVWDGGGTDTYNLSNYTGATVIDLRPGEWTTTSSVQLANLGSGHFARGNVANALQFNGDARSLIENAVGGSGGDTIIANQAANQLTGNGGADTFKWSALGDVGSGALKDVVTDFVHSTDRIDLSGIDAIAGTAGDDAFSFLGTGAFSNVAGQLRYEVTGGAAHIFGDVDGNGIADFEIVLNNVPLLTGGDFFL